MDSATPTTSTTAGRANLPQMNFVFRPMATPWRNGDPRRHVGADARARPWYCNSTWCGPTRAVLDRHFVMDNAWDTQETHRWQPPAPMPPCDDGTLGPRPFGEQSAGRHGGCTNLPYRVTPRQDLQGNDDGTS